MWIIIEKSLELPYIEIISESISHTFQIYEEGSNL